ncbi:MAG: rhodanese-like domain-containing protein [Flavobacteriaceae bacterium]
MSSIRILIILIFTIVAGCRVPSIDHALKKYNLESVPYIKVSTILTEQPYLIIDAREKEEYMVSHIPGALWVGYKTFQMESLNERFPKDTSIVVYCSVGVRSEDIGEQLMEQGFTDVHNLYGGIFEWKNLGGPVVDSLEKDTENVHAYSKYWSHLLTEANKVY